MVATTKFTLLHKRICLNCTESNSSVEEMSDIHITVAKTFEKSLHKYFEEEFITDSEYRCNKCSIKYT